MKKNFELAFTQLLQEDYCLRHHHNKSGYKNVGMLAKSMLGSFSTNCLTSILIQINKWCVIIVYLIYLPQNKANIQKPSEYVTLRLTYIMTVHPYVDR